MSEQEYPRVNKLADLQDFNQVVQAAIIERLLKTKSAIDRIGLPYTSHMQDHWLRLWEYSNAVIESRLDKRMVVLDAGGSGTIFGYYMAAEGCEVHTVDFQEDLVENANKLSEALGLDMHHSTQDIRTLSYADGYFDAVYSISVIEHLFVEEQSVALKQLVRVLKPGGVLALTFDYGSKAAGNPLLDPDEVFTRLVIPSGLDVLGNEQFHAASNDLWGTSEEYTFGSLFLRKPGDLALPNNPERISVKASELLESSRNDPSFKANYYRPGRKT